MSTNPPISAAEASRAIPCRADSDDVQDIMSESLGQAYLEMATRTNALQNYANSAGIPVELLEQDILLGCGRFGCVYGTKREDVALKLTWDGSEALLALIAMQFPKLKGLVRYYGVVTFPASREVRKLLKGCKMGGLDPVRFKRIESTPSRLYAIWREKLPVAGDSAIHDYDQETQVYLEMGSLDQCKAPLHRAYRVAHGTLKYNPRYLAMAYDIALALRPWLRQEAGLNTTSGEYNNIALDAPVRLPTNAPKDIDLQRALWQVAGGYAAAVDKLRRYTEEVIRPGGLLAVFQTLLHFWERGVILADIHTNNWGARRGQRELVILDAGYNLIINPKYQRMWVDGIDERSLLEDA